MIADAESILRVCGIDTYLHVGCGQSTLVFELLKRSIDAYGIDSSQEIITKNTERTPDRFFNASLLNYPFKQEVFGTVIIGAELFNFSNADLPKVFAALQWMAKNNIVLYFTPEVIQQNAGKPEFMSRIFWEKLGIQAGLRLHPRSMLITPYDALENERLGKFIFFERIPQAALQRFSFNWLLQNRDLHMDMLREAGRRSDAHVSRYVLAAGKIRPGDVVVDAACGLGYGTAVLAACSPGAKFIGVDIDPESIEYANANFAANNSGISFQAADVTKLAFLPDHSVDAFISFETIEHVENYDVFLAEIKRVLKPDGRFVGSVPNMWCDETGKDPNPYHFHVFDWAKLQTAIDKHFIVDDRWSQTAGGGFKLRDSKRSIKSVPVEYPDQVEAEWWLISACGNPLNAAAIPYTNSFHKNQNNDIPAHVDFAKYYDNPWLYRVMVQLGERLTDRKILMDFCVKILESAKLGSADQGAALCVICYQILESGNTNYKDVESLINIFNAYDQAYDKKNLHAYRWAISLHYVGGRLLLALGKRQEAHAAFLTCAEMDPMIFSPLLATKTVSARMYSGLLYISIGSIEEGKNELKLAVKEAHRVMQGDWHTLVGTLDDPLPFGLQEAAELLDIASQCSQVLHAIERNASVPGYIWDKVNLKRFGLVEWNKSLERENNLLRLSMYQQKLADKSAAKTDENGFIQQLSGILQPS